MKNRKNILSAINLFVFLLSFALAILNSFPSASDNRLPGHFQKQFSQKLYDLANNNSQLSEENETETEDGFELEAMVLPFFFSHFQRNLPSFSPRSAQLIAEQASKPIYVAIHNFRI